MNPNEQLKVFQYHFNFENRKEIQMMLIGHLVAFSSCGVQHKFLI
jgi:hypothetical protein